MRRWLQNYTIFMCIFCLLFSVIYFLILILFFFFFFCLAHCTECTYACINVNSKFLWICSFLKKKLTISWNKSFKCSFGILLQFPFYHQFFIIHVFCQINCIDSTFVLIMLFCFYNQNLLQLKYLNCQVIFLQILTCLKIFNTFHIITHFTKITPKVSQKICHTNFFLSF